MNTRLLTTASKVTDKSFNFIKKSALIFKIKIYQAVMIISFVTALFISFKSYGQSKTGIVATSLRDDRDNVTSTLMAVDKVFGGGGEGDTIKTRIPASVQPDGFLLVNYKLVMVKNGVITAMDKNIRLSNGIKVLREGYAVKPSGYIILINQGEYLNMAGKILPIDKTNVFIE